jgi:hypothetical protein
VCGEEYLDADSNENVLYVDLWLEGDKIVAEVY